VVRDHQQIRMGDATTAAKVAIDEYVCGRAGEQDWQRADESGTIWVSEEHLREQLGEEQKQHRRDRDSCPGDRKRCHEVALRFAWPRFCGVRNQTR
jgi:hypothetical protein